MMVERIKIGISGTGFISKGFFELVRGSEKYAVSKVLTRRAPSHFHNTMFAEVVTNDISDLVENSDVILECSGDAIFATEVVELAFQANKPVVTMNAEFQILSGTFYQKMGRLHESTGDQPGSLAALDHDVRMMGFEPLVYGSQKSYLNQNPEYDEIQFWSKKNNQSAAKTLSFYDGTKVQIEAALTANGLGAGIIQTGLKGPIFESTREGALELAKLADSKNRKLSDFVLNKNGTGEVFIVATHKKLHQPNLAYYKMGKGPYYYFERPFHLGHFEILKSIEFVLEPSNTVFNNGNSPSTSVAAIAKGDLPAGTQIDQAVGSFQMRGVAVQINDHPNHCPISLLQNCEIKRSIGEGELITLEDVSLQDSLALRAWNKTVKQLVISREPKHSYQ